MLGFLNSFFIHSEIKNVVIFHDLGTVIIVNSIVLHQYEANLSLIFLNIEQNITSMHRLPKNINQHVIIWSLIQKDLSTFHKILLQLPYTEVMRNQLNGIYVDWLDTITIYAWNDFQSNKSKNYNRLIVLSQAQFLSCVRFYQQIFFNKWNPVPGRKLSIYTTLHPSRSMLVYDASGKNEGIGGNEIIMASIVADYLKAKT